MSVVNNTEILTIVRGLVQATSAGAMTWTRFADSESEYQAGSSRFVYFVRTRDADDAPPHGFQVFKSGIDGPLVDIVTDPRSEALFKAVTELYSAAKLSAYGITSLSDEVLKDLGQQGV